MKYHPATVYGYHTTSGGVCADCAEACPALISGPSEAVRTYDRDLGRVCLACGDTFAGPVHADPTDCYGEEL